MAKERVTVQRIPDYFARSESFRSGTDVVAKYAAQGTPPLSRPPLGVTRDAAAADGDSPLSLHPSGP
jgi:hypothetical protein